MAEPLNTSGEPTDCTVQSVHAQAQVDSEVQGGLIIQDKNIS